jgi:DNA-binding transcriptional MocR family regulator
MDQGDGDVWRSLFSGFARNTLRMGMSSIPDNRIERGSETLSQCLRELK